MVENIPHKIIGNQIVKFVLSAGAGFLVDQLAFNLLYHFFFTQKSYRVLNASVSNYAISFSISYIMGVVVNFLITHFFVFSESRLTPYKQFVRFASVAVIGYFANLGLIELLVKTMDFSPPIARPLAALSLFFASYFVHKLFSFSLSLRHHAVQSNHR